MLGLGSQKETAKLNARLPLQEKLWVALNTNLHAGPIQSELPCKRFLQTGKHESILVAARETLGTPSVAVSSGADGRSRTMPCGKTGTQHRPFDFAPHSNMSHMVKTLVGSPAMSGVPSHFAARQSFGRLYCASRSPLSFKSLVGGKSQILIIEGESSNTNSEQVQG